MQRLGVEAPSLFRWATRRLGRQPSVLCGGVSSMDALAGRQPQRGLESWPRASVLLGNGGRIALVPEPLLAAAALAESMLPRQQAWMTPGRQRG